MVEAQNIPVDRALRVFIGTLAVAYESQGVSALQPDAAFMRGPGLQAQLVDGNALDIERNFAGFNWQFTLSLSELKPIANGEVGEIPMIRNAAGSVESTGSDIDDSAYLADSLLAAVGFGDGPTADGGSLLESSKTDSESSKVDFLPNDAEEDPDLDESDVTREEVDDLLNHPEVQKLLGMMGIEPGADSDDSGDLEPEVEDRTEVDLRVPDLDLDLDESLDEEEENEGESEAEGIQQASQFLTLMVDADKLELADNIDQMELARRLLPILDDEEGSERVRAARLIDWLLDQAEVEDVFMSDDEMTRIIKAW